MSFIDIDCRLSEAKPKEVKTEITTEVVETKPFTGGCCEISATIEGCLVDTPPNYRVSVQMFNSRGCESFFNLSLVLPFSVEMDSSNNSVRREPDSNAFELLIEYSKHLPNYDFHLSSYAGGQQDAIVINNGKVVDDYRLFW